MTDPQTLRLIELTVVWALMAFAVCGLAYTIISGMKREKQWAKEKHAARWDCCDRAHGEYYGRRIVFLSDLPPCQAALLFKMQHFVIQVDKKYGAFIYYDYYLKWYYSLTEDRKS